jgi:plastocyanin
MRRLVLVGAAAAACLAAVPAGARPAARTATVIIDKLAFQHVPANLRVGDSVLWVNRDLFRHSATSNGHFDVDLSPGARRRMLLTRAGAFAFTCKYHPGMKGVLKVGQ